MTKQHNFDKEDDLYLGIADKKPYRFDLQKNRGFKLGTSWRFRKKEIYEWIDKQSEK
ncbi:MAG: DNA-binding protein [Proteobacteria bacterium]|nr:DNA-binding protein [Pseudomonadota bacterium]